MDLNHMHEYDPRRKDGKCKVYVRDGICHLPEDAPVHERWRKAQLQLIAEQRWYIVIPVGETTGLCPECGWQIVDPESGPKENGAGHHPNCPIGRLTHTLEAR